VWSIRHDGSGRERVVGALPEGEILSVLASSDGMRLYVEAGRSYAPHLISIAREGSLEEPVALPPLDGGRTFSAADWSPDGRWLIGFAREANGAIAPSLYIYELERKSFRKLADFKTPHGCAWLPDSKRIALWAGGELMVLDRETGTIVSAGSVGENVSNLRLSRDGRTLIGNTAANEYDIWMLDYGMGER
jgi:hypothetical protein